MIKTTRRLDNRAKRVGKTAGRKRTTIERDESECRRLNALVQMYAEHWPLKTPKPSEAVVEQLAGRGPQVFLSPRPRYGWHEIVGGVTVSWDGTAKKMWAVALNTFRGFHKKNKARKGAGPAFRGYFDENIEHILSELKKIRTADQLHSLENKICGEIRPRLSNIKTKQLLPYNKIRKPVDLYIEHLVVMAEEIDAATRRRLVPILFVPLDSQIFKEAFRPEELAKHSLGKDATYKDVSLESDYLSLQCILRQKAKVHSYTYSVPFHPIYFDLLWNNRYKSSGGNLFETSLKSANTMRKTKNSAPCGIR